jgi:hypothetical protein
MPAEGQSTFATKKGSEYDFFPFAFIGLRSADVLFHWELCFTLKATTENKFVCNG